MERMQTYRSSLAYMRSWLLSLLELPIWYVLSLGVQRYAYDALSVLQPLTTMRL